MCKVECEIIFEFYLAFHHTEVSFLMQMWQKVDDCASERARERERERDTCVSKVCLPF